MVGQVLYTKRVVKTVALVIFTIQMILALQKYISNPAISHLGTKTLSSLEKSIMISVCKSSQFNYSRGQVLGYNWAADFLTGKTKNSTILSWTGILRNSTFNETFNYLYTPDLQNIDFKFTTGNFDITTGDIMNRFLIPLGMCKVFVGNPTGPIKVSIKSNGEISEYSFYLSDPVATDLFQLPYSLSTGDKIRIETNPNPKIKKYVDYHIQLKEKSIETDKGSCIDYASSKYKSYASCVNVGLRDKILPVLGCMAPWISREEHCTGTLLRLQKREKIVQWLREAAKKVIF